MPTIKKGQIYYDAAFEEQKKKDRNIKYLFFTGAGLVYVVVIYFLIDLVAMI